MSLVVVIANLIQRPVLPPRGNEEPQRVAFYRAAQPSSNVIVPSDRRRRGQTTSAQVVRQIVTRQAWAGELGAQASGEPVAAVLRHDVDLHAAGCRFSGAGRRLDDDFLKGVSVILKAAAAEHSRIHAGNVVGHIVRALAVDAEKASVTSHSADIVKVRASRVGPHDERQQLGRTSARRDRVQRLACDRRLLLDVLDVHDRRRSRDRDRLGHRAHPQFSVHGCGEPGRQFDPVPPERAETGQGERDGIQARPEVDDAVEPLVIRGDGADPFDQGGARGFHGDTRHHGPRRVSDHSGDVAGLCLRPCGGRQEHQTPRYDDESHELMSVHRLVPFQRAC